MSKIKAAGATGIAAALSAYCFVQNRLLTVDNYKVECKNLPQSFEGVKILHISDLHKKRYGDGFNNLINVCQVCDPDYIFFTGDLFSRSEENLTPKLVLMRRLMKLAPVYYVMGNHETDAAVKSEALNYKLEAEGVHILRNSYERIYRGGDYINIYGAELSMDYYRSADGIGYRGLKKADREALQRLMGEPDHEKCCILLAHNPFPFREYAEWGADLVFSGHCHGGVIRLPIAGGLLSPERRFFPEYTKGVYEGYGSCMVVSAGLGKFRLNNPSQLICAYLTGK
ncbi:metallophosphoesterase [Ruminococcus sp. Marseille-P6503]|uniref:metallophosphoesterase n=1 Tax=Ruminococcus sp. Marseille-P6503 TaxID=2364796 RepID=UPI0013DE238D|nr:metallophosphoesterase [Ruminococcus sp. Marseille-P6503]